MSNSDLRKIAVDFANGHIDFMNGFGDYPTSYQYKNERIGHYGFYASAIGLTDEQYKYISSMVPKFHEIKMKFINDEPA